jgi:hypothetical protein
VLTTFGLIALFAGFLFVMGFLIPNLLMEESTKPAGDEAAG